MIYNFYLILVGVLTDQTSFTIGVILMFSFGL